MKVNGMAVTMFTVQKYRNYPSFLWDDNIYEMKRQDVFTNNHLPNWMFMAGFQAVTTNRGVLSLYSQYWYETVQNYTKLNIDR